MEKNLEKRMEEIRNRMIELNEKKKTLNERNDAGSITRTKIEEERHNLQNEFERILQQLSPKESETKLTEPDARKARIEDLETMIKRHEAGMESLEGDSSGGIEELAGRNEEIANLRREIEERRRQIKELREQNRPKNKSNKSELSINDLETMIKSHEAEIAKLEGDSSGDIEELAGRNEEIANRRREIEEWKRQIKELREKNRPKDKSNKPELSINDLETMIKSHEAEIERLEGDSSGDIEELAGRNEEIAKLRREIEEWQRRIEELREKNKEGTENRPLEHMNAGKQDVREQDGRKQDEGKKAEEKTKIGPIRKFFVTIITKIMSKLKLREGGFWYNALHGLKAGLLKKPNKKALNSAKTEIKGQNPTETDITWFLKKHVEDRRTGKENSLARSLYADEFTAIEGKLKDKTEDEQTQILDQLIKEHNIPRVNYKRNKSEKNNKKIDIALYQATKSIIEQATSKGLKTKTEEDGNRSIGEIYNELDVVINAEKEGIQIKDAKENMRPLEDISKELEKRMELRRKTDEVSTHSAIPNGKITPESEHSGRGEH